MGFKLANPTHVFHVALPWDVHSPQFLRAHACKFFPVGNCVAVQVEDVQTGEGCFSDRPDPADAVAAQAQGFQGWKGNSDHRLH